VYEVKSLALAITLNIIIVTEHLSIAEPVLTLKPTFTVQLFENPKQIQPLRQERKNLLLLSGATQMNSSLNGLTAVITYFVDR
jgi:hypothetical protein